MYLHPMVPDTPNAKSTRVLLLETAAGLMHESGFRSTSLDQILERAGMTKGALYYHFKNKQELGLAVVDELYRPMILGEWRQVFSWSSDPVANLEQFFNKKRAGACLEGVRCGCPLNNLAQEMAAVDEQFRQQIESLFADWRSEIAKALEKGKHAGYVAAGVDSAKAALFITVVIEGAMGAAKNARDPKLMNDALETLQLFLHTLRPRVRMRS